MGPFCILRFLFPFALYLHDFALLFFTGRSLFVGLYICGADGGRFYSCRRVIAQRWSQRASHEASQFAFPSL